MCIVENFINVFIRISSEAADFSPQCDFFAQYNVHNILFWINNNIMLQNAVWRAKIARFRTHLS